MAGTASPAAVRSSSSVLDARCARASRRDRRARLLQLERELGGHRTAGRQGLGVETKRVGDHSTFGWGERPAPSKHFGDICRRDPEPLSKLRWADTRRPQTLG